MLAASSFLSKFSNLLEFTVKGIDSLVLPNLLLLSPVQFSLLEAELPTWQF